MDYLLITETKLDNIFPNGQLLIKGCSTPYRFERDAQGGDIMLFIRKDIPSKLLAAEDSWTAGFYIEIKLCKKKLLL